MYIIHYKHQFEREKEKQEVELKKPPAPIEPSAKPKTPPRSTDQVSGLELILALEDQKNPTDKNNPKKQ